MKKHTNLLNLSLILFIVATLASCSKTDNAFKIIPDNATMVAVFDGASLSSKSGVDDFTQTNFYSAIQKEMSASELEKLKIFEPVLANTQEAGINLNTDFFMFSFKKEKTNYMAAHFQLLDKAKFEKVLKDAFKISESSTTIQQDGDYSYVGGEGEGMMMWNDKKLMLLFDMKSRQETAGLLADLKGLMDANSDKSILDNDDFNEFLKDKKDISFWVDYAIFYDNMPQMQQVALQANLPYDMTGTIMHFNIDFQNGKTVMDYKANLNEEMVTYMEDHKLIKDKFDTDLLAYLPATSFANASMALDFMEYYNLILNMMEQKQQDLDQVDAAFKAQTGITIKEALNDFSGDMVFSLHGFGTQEVEEVDYMAYYQSEDRGDISKYTTIKEKPVPYYSVAIKMNSDKVFNILIENLKSAAVKTGDYYTFKMGNVELYFGLFKTNLIATNDKSLVDKLANGEDFESLATTNIASSLKDFPTYLFLDLNIDHYPTNMKEMIQKAMGEKYVNFEKGMQIFDNLEVLPESMTSQKVILNMTDKSKNSLELMIQAMDDNVEALAN